MKPRTLISMLIILGLAAGCSLTCLRKAAGGPKKQYLRVGVYDSRAIAIAYGHSDHWNQILKGKMEELEKAKAAGDQKKIEELESWGPERQKEAHLRAFGTAPVHKLFEPVKDKLAEVAQQAGVDLIVSQWELDYQSPDAETIDVTDQLAELYHPNEQARKIIDQLDTWQPMSREVIEEHAH